MLAVCTFVSLLFSNVFAADVMKARFLAADSYVTGNVTVRDSVVTVDLNASELDVANLPSGCNITAGFLYHVHSSWTNANNQSHYGAHCNSTFVGGHYDPYAACSAKTGNSYCKVKGGCINTTYSCTPSTYESNRYSCEVGDWSGKYGTLFITDGQLSTTTSSFGDITGNDLVGKSVVFHCANNLKPAFCAPFLPAVGVVGTSTSQRQTNGFLLKADFSTAPSANSKKNAYITIDYTGDVTYQFDLKVFQAGTPCPGGVAEIWIGDAWTDGTHLAQSSLCTSSIYGNFYNPTNQCYASANKTDCTFCKKGKLCGNSGYTYKCNYTTNPFSCSPMDFSGKYGSLNLTSLAKRSYSHSTTDRYLPDLNHLVHKSVVLMCSSNQQPLYCAKLQNVGVGVALATFSTVNSGAQGNVMVSDGQVNVQVGFAVARHLYANGTVLPEGCFDAGLKAHIHETWTYSDLNDRVGPSACGSAYTGGHWDPWAACSTKTANTAVCKSSAPTSSPTMACVPVGGSEGNGNYKCNATYYVTDPFSCEVGDWSGKYGVYPVKGNSSQVSRTDHSYLEVDATELVGRSIVFHCANDDTRAFCAPFILQSGRVDGDDTPPSWPLKTQTGNLITNASVVSPEWGSIYLQDTGFYYVNIDFTNSTCSPTSSIGYGIFKDASCNHMYDPTIQCIPNSEYNGTLCLDQKTCDATSTYNCQFETSAYSCSPSDLSGKYGITNTSKYLLVSGWDDLMFPLAQLQTKYFGLYCTDTWKTEPKQCYPWTVDVEVTNHPTMSPIPYPTKSPTIPPTKRPTGHPTEHPTKHPTHRPSPSPTPQPTTLNPTAIPTLPPTFHPSNQPTLPTVNPTPHPTSRPTSQPSSAPTFTPTTTAAPSSASVKVKSAQSVTVAMCSWLIMLALLWI